jgi:hypothetical protein
MNLIIKICTIYSMMYNRWLSSSNI